MDEKVKTLQNDLDTLNPRSKIEQAILPRLERTRENFSVEPQIFTRRGKKILRKPNLNNDNRSSNSYLINAKSHPQFLSANQSLYSNNSSRSVNSKLNDLDRPFLKPIIHHDSDSLRSLSKLKLSHDAIRKSVNFNDDIEYKYNNRQSVDRQNRFYADY